MCIRSVDGRLATQIAHGDGGLAALVGGPSKHDLRDLDVTSLLEQLWHIRHEFHVKLLLDQSMCT